MKYSISQTNVYDVLASEKLTVKILRLGAELFSVKVLHPTHGEIGLLLNDDEIEPDHSWWNSHAPFLFPIVGGLVNKTSHCRDGKTIKLEGHGFARKTVFSVIDKGQSDKSVWIEYEIDNTAVSNAAYPWQFEFRVRYELSDNGLNVAIKVKNNDETTMWYQCGWHPGFKAPFIYGKGNKADVNLILPKGKAIIYECDRESFLTGKKKEIELGGVFPFTEEGLDYTYVFDMHDIPDKTVKLFDPNSGITIHLSFNDFPHLGIWSNANGPFICLEPWQGCDDFANPTLFEDKFGIASLEAGQQDQREINLSLFW